MTPLANDGLAVEQLLLSDGWQVVSKLLDKYADDQVEELMSYGGSDANIIKHKQIAARIMRSVKDSLALDLRELVELARQEMKAELLEEYNP